MVGTASGGSVGPFRYVVIYNDTPAGDPLVAYYDYSSSITLLDGETLTVDFGASDAPMSDAELGKAKGGKVLHFPMILGAVVVTYNLPEVQKALKLSGVNQRQGGKCLGHRGPPSIVAGAKYISSSSPSS